MADENSDALERDENTVSDAPAASAVDTEQVVEGADFDTKSINSRLDGLEDMISRMMGKMEQLADAQSILVESGAIVDTVEDPSDNDGIDNFNNPNFDTLDLRITD